MTCQDIPQILESEPRQTACERVAVLYPTCCCEAVSVQPDLSPGPVLNDESIARFVSTHHFDPADQKIIPSLFEHAGKGGMSIARVEHTGPDGMAEQQSADGYLGFVISTARDIRDLCWDGARMFAIYDTALPGQCAHGDICQTIFAPKSKRSEMRRKLQMAFSQTLQSAM